jgi:arginyl-tRNA synthetase
VIFDWDEFMTFEGNSGPYIQYAYVRARRILENYSDNLSQEVK